LGETPVTDLNSRIRGTGGPVAKDMIWAITGGG
jgi:hypothetical protein